MIDVVVIILGVLLLLGVLGHAFPSPPHSSPRPMGVPSTDLRVSEFAPDLAKAAIASDNWELLTPVRRAAEKKEWEKREKERRIQADIERRERHVNHDKQMWEHYQEAVNVAKAKRWAEGNPVTRENPLLDHERPHKPMFFHGIF